MTAFISGNLIVRSPVASNEIGAVQSNLPTETEATIGSCYRYCVDAAFNAWCNVPTSRRGKLVSLFGGELCTTKANQYRPISIEVSKITRGVCVSYGNNGASTSIRR